MKVEVDVLGSLSLVSPHGLCGREATLEHSVRAQELCKSRGGLRGLLVPSSPYDLSGRKAILNLKQSWQSS